METIYKKDRVRARYLIRQQVCDYAERILFPKLCEGKNFFEPLFIFSEGKGVSVYYDFTSLEQDPTSAAEYFKANPPKFWEAVDSFNKESEKLKELIAKAEIESFKEIFNLLAIFWSKILLFVILGNLRKDLVDYSISQEALKLRLENDKTIYDATACLLEIMKQRVPKEYTKYVDFLTFEEIDSRNFPKFDELEKRKLHFIYFKGKIDTDHSLEDFANQNNIKIEEAATSNALKFNGTGASKGIARGKVRVIWELNQMNNLKDGEILVTPMTTPDFVPYLRNAAAIVTDEGGITCHAAIMAREFKVPAVIGTDNATKILMDGDEVEVDGQQGIVRIINREN